MWVNPKVANPSQNGKTDVCTWWPDGKRMGYGVTYSSPNGSPGQGGRREKPNDRLGPWNGSGDSFPSAEIDNKKVSCWTEFVADGTKTK